MSHSKYVKRGFSWYIECCNRSAKKYMNTCKICGHKGYSPVIEAEDFFDKNVLYSQKKAIYQGLTQTLPKLPLDRLGRCEYCTQAMGDDFQAA
ncbi:MAG: hypothetical protein IKI11_10970 [Neisseriaceae bacterium]|nr:hypothetical protein [Neisseriaceae bacterium]